MTTVNEQIVIGRKFRKLIDESAKIWQRISFWTKASDVEFNDGMTAETKLGSIDGITDSLINPSSRIAASAKALNTLNDSLPQFIYDSTGMITGYKTKVGADTVFPFSSGFYKTSYILTAQNKIVESCNTEFTVDITRKYKIHILMPKNGYSSRAIQIFNNNTEIFSHSVTDSTYETIDLDLHSGDSIKIEVKKNASNAYAFYGVIFI